MTNVLEEISKRMRQNDVCHYEVESGDRKTTLSRNLYFYKDCKVKLSSDRQTVRDSQRQTDTERQRENERETGRERECVCVCV